MNQRTASIFTVIALVAATLIYTVFHSSPGLADFGTFFGGIATTIAIVWIIINSISQSKALAFQRKELELQRSATQDIADYNLLSGALLTYEPALRKIQSDGMSLWSIFLRETGAKVADEMPHPSEIISCISDDGVFGEWLESKVEGGDIIVQARLNAFLTRLQALEDVLLGQSSEINVHGLLFNGSHEKRALRRLRQILLSQN